MGALVGSIVMAVGAIFLFLGGLGIFRFPDVYNRLQAGTKCTTLGAVCVIIGVGITEPTWIFKTAIIATFILLTNPLSAHALARASRRSGVKLWENSVVDKWQESAVRKPRAGAGSGEGES